MAMWCSTVDPTTSMSTATHATYNVRSEAGRFEHVVGTTGMQLAGETDGAHHLKPFAFTGSRGGENRP